MSIAVVGSGPAALMAADVLSKGGASVELFEKRAGIGRKLAIAGSSGLNITHAAAFPDFIHHYGADFDWWSALFAKFGREAWLDFLHSLGLKTFQGTSDRYFIEDMNAAKLLRLWRERLSERGVLFHMDSEMTTFEAQDNKVRLTFQNGKTTSHEACVMALGGGSYLGDDKATWVEMFRTKKISVRDLAPSNVGFHVDWPKAFLDEAVRKPLKNVTLASSKGSKRGDILITEYGIEGTPVYFVGTSEKVTIDLKPDLSIEEMRVKCNRAKENLSPIRRVQKYLNLDDAAQALLYHCTERSRLNVLDELLSMIKALPLKLNSAQPIEEAISTSGGVALCELDENLMLKSQPGVFLAGEMLDWDAPTGGFLIQGCATQGFVAGMGALEWRR